ncbi:MAG: hypothetical protein RIC55_33730 [Pirellulaceae bacterium]
MTQILVRCVPLTVACCLTAAALAGEPIARESAPARGPAGQTVRKYTKQWRDDYFNFNRVVYHAYTTMLKDETGQEVSAEIRHGRATGYHENGQKAWEGDYREGRRVGTFSMWAENGARTNLSQWEDGAMHGTYRQWASDGRKIREETYQRGKLEGEARWWAPDGELACEGIYRHGRPWSGTFVELDPSPPRSRSVIRSYEEGEKTGEMEVPGGSANWW